MTTVELVAEVRTLRELAPTFGVRSQKQSIARVAEQALEADDPETRELAEQLLRGIRKLSFD